jgi:hypothetical protein
MNRTSIKRELLNLIVTAAITVIIVTPITLYLTYKLNDYWSRDEISIARVDLMPDTTKPLYPSKTMMVLNQNPRFKNYLLARRSSIYQFNLGFYNSSLRKFLSKKEIDEIKTVLHDFSKFDEELKIREDSTIQKLRSYKKEMVYQTYFRH